MDSSDPIEFTHADRKRLYEYVERHGAVTLAALQEGLDLDPTSVRHHVAILKRDGRLDAVDDALCVTVDAGTEAEHVTDDLEFHIRPARQDDLSGLVGVIRQVTAERPSIEAERVADEIGREATVFRHNDRELRAVFVATVEDDVVGWVQLHTPHLEKLAHTAELTVGVLEDYRRRGLGSHLLFRGLEWAGVNDLETVYQSLPATNETAIAFLEAHGWEIDAVREGHYRLDGRPVDEVMLAIDLSA